MSAPYGGAQSPGQIEGAGRDVLLVLALVPFFALTQLGSLGCLPFSRDTIADLCARRFYSFGLTIFGVVVFVGFLLVGGVSLSSGAPITERLVPYLVSALLIFSALPALTPMALFGATMKSVTGSNRAGSFSLRELTAASFLGATGFLVVQLSVHLALELRGGNYEPLPIAAFAATIFGIASFALSRLFRRHYALASLLP